jgi:hypothetical protein
MTVETKYAIKDKVKIIPFTEIAGIIIGIWFDKETKYFVRYFMDGHINESYFYEEEIKGS